MKIRRCFIFILIPGLILFPFMLFAQLSQGGLPRSFSSAVVPDPNEYITPPLPSMDVLMKEDQDAPLPYRFAVNLPVDLGITSSGQWQDIAETGRIWRLSIKSPGAQALILYFDRFHIPEGGKVFVYNPKRTQLLGAFTSLNNNDLSTFATGLIQGDELTIEYNAPGDLPTPDIHISEVGHAYRGVTGYGTSLNGFGGSGVCEVNVNCTEGSGWQKEKRSVTRITVKRGGQSLWCTGSLVNNTRNDGKPYVITADHCGKSSSVADLSQWIFYFNYEGKDCQDPTIEPTLRSITGATLVAHGGDAGATGSDFFLVLLKSAIPDSFGVYFNGWSRETVPPSPSGTGIHHPQGDIKKISTYTSPLQPAHWVGNPALAHWRVTWSGTPNGHGTTEGGSSGSPLFDSMGRLIGTLTGGDSSCDSASLNLPDYYGMFSYHWDKNGTDSISMLKCWLDPDNTGLMSINGWALSVGEPSQAGTITVFPNPVNQVLNMKTGSWGGNPVSITIHDIWGNLRFKRDWSVMPGSQVQVDMTGFAPGIYMLGISDGRSQAVRKIIKQ